MAFSRICITLLCFQSLSFPLPSPMSLMSYYHPSSRYSSFLLGTQYYCNTGLQVFNELACLYLWICQWLVNKSDLPYLIVFKLSPRINISMNLVSIIYIQFTDRTNPWNFFFSSPFQASFDCGSISFLSVLKHTTQ